MARTYRELQQLAKKFRLVGKTPNVKLNITKVELRKAVNKAIVENKKQKSLAKNILKNIETEQPTYNNKGSIKLSKDVSIKTVLQNLKEVGNKFPVIEFNNKYFALTNERRGELLNKMGTDEDLYLYGYEENADQGGSDVNFDAEFNGQVSGADVKIFYKNKSKLNKKLVGKFFPYTHNLDFDLTRYGIFKEVNQEDYKDNCFIMALKYSNILEESEILNIKSIVRNGYVPASKFKEISEKFNFSIELTKMDTTGEARKQYFNKGTERIIRIAIFEEHYFINEKVNITSYAINNYNEVKDKREWFKFIKSNERGERFIESYNVIRMLLKNKDKLLNKIERTDELMKTAYYKKVKSNMDINELVIDDNNCKLYEYESKEDKTKPEHIVFFDFETTTDGDTHKPYLMSYSSVDLTNDIYVDSNKIESIIGENCAIEFLLKLENNTLCIAHNLGYDLNFIIKHLSVRSIIKKSESSVISLNGVFNNYNKRKNISLSFKCSYAMIGEALKEFNPMFKLENDTKEIMPYEIYTEENVKNHQSLISEALKILKVEDHTQFKQNIKEWKLTKDDIYYDHIGYSKIYCDIDVKVTKLGYLKFREMMLTVTTLDIINQVTLAGLGDLYLKLKGCYDGVYSFSGVTREFIELCNVGGRTMTRDNEKHIVEEDINDFDGVSLYPSAMNRMDGFLIGKPKVLSPKQLKYNFIKKQSGYFVKIEITKVGINRHFSLLNVKNKQGVREFTNKCIGIHYLNKTMLEDAIEFQKIEFKILQGLYFDKGFNPKINEVMKFLFEERLKAKKEGNPIQNVYKKLMNSSYGKAGLKAIETSYQIVNTKKFHTLLENQYNFIEYASAIDGSNKFSVKFKKNLNDHFNFCHVACDILSMSKRIMNEVMCTAEDNNIMMYYQDTDSIHMLDKDINKLSEIYNKKYNRELIGKGLGQFHTDFGSDVFGNEKVSIISNKLVAYGKKSYVDRLIVTNIKTGEQKTDYHIRMKGIPIKAVWGVINRDFNGNPIALYEALNKGEEVKFNILEGCVKFKSSSNFTISSLKHFERILNKTVKPCKEI